MMNKTRKHVKFNNKDKETNDYFLNMGIPDKMNVIVTYQEPPENMNNELTKEQKEQNRNDRLKNEKKWLSMRYVVFRYVVSKHLLLI